jgi:hypothetical protein
VRLELTSEEWKSPAQPLYQPCIKLVGPFHGQSRWIVSTIAIAHDIKNFAVHVAS